MFSYAIKNGTIIDGSIRKAYVGTIYLKDGQIAKISSHDNQPSDEFTHPFRCKPLLWFKF